DGHSPMFLGTDPYDVLDGIDEDLPVPCLSGQGGFTDGVDEPVHVLIVRDDLDLRFRHEGRPVLLAPELLLDPLLLALAFYLADGETRTAGASERGVDISHLCGPDYGFYLFHVLSPYV